MRYNHHPDPAIAFCIEVEEIYAQFFDAGVGLADPIAVRDRWERAMQFRVGGDLGAIKAKNLLRSLYAEH